MNIAVLEFFIENAQKEEFENKRILEVGSKYVNGSVRPLIKKFFNPKEYIGVDIEKGKFVDFVCNAENLVDYFGKESFDVVITTELLEHVKDWRKVINNMKEVLKPNGYIYITTRSKGFPYHGYPYDFWRYEIEDMKEIFKDFEIIKLEKDHEAPGVFLKARKPKDYTGSIDLSEICLYSIILGKRTKEIVAKFSFQRKCKIFIQNLIDLIKNKLRRMLTLK
jgi:SAM-dependent methyltransferase